MIQTETVDGLLRIYDPDADVVTSYASGDHRMFAPDGKSLLLESSGVAYRFFFETGDKYTFAINSQFDYKSTLRRIIGNEVGQQPLPRRWADWWAGRQNGDRYLHSTFREYYSSTNQPYTLCVFDAKENRVVHQFPFAKAMPGATWAGRPHDLRYIPETDTWVAWLSGYANPGWHPNAMYAFNGDGTSVRKISSSEKMSHPTLSGDRVAYGSGNDIVVGPLESLEPSGNRWTLSDSYGHGTLIGDTVVFSNAERFVNTFGEHRARDVQVMLWHVTDGDPRVIRDIPQPTDFFPARARPTLSHDATKAAWQELYKGHACVMVWEDDKEDQDDNWQQIAAAKGLLAKAVDAISDANGILERIGG